MRLAYLKQELAIIKNWSIHFSVLISREHHQKLYVDRICYGLILAEKDEYIFFQYQNYLAWSVSSDVIKDCLSQIVLCLVIIISENVLSLGTVFPNVL